MSSVAIDCQELRKTYGGKHPVEAVRGVNLDVAGGECFGVLGPNGAGKTTTIEILEGLLEQTSGEVEILGMRWKSHEEEIRQRIGISLQETRFSDKLTVAETLALFRSFYRSGLSPESAMARVSLQSKAAAWIKNLSGGQKQRLAFAVSIVGDPDLLFLDEPTTGLDPQSRRELWAIIEEFRDQRRTVLLTTHYMEEAERLCDRVAIFDQGKVIASGTPQELIRSLGAEHVVEFTLHRENANELPADEWLSVDSATDAVTEDGGVRLTVSQPHIAIPSLLRRIESFPDTELTNLTTRHASLEDVFVKLTGRTLVAAEEESSE